MMLKPALSSALLALALIAPAVPSFAQGVQVAGEPSADGTKKEEAVKPKKKAEKGAKAKRKAKKKVESKYKSTALADNTESSYRFDEDGNPIGAAAKKKAAAEKAKKAASEEAAEEAPFKAACSEDETCVDKSDADAL
jgi:colicin import membrane protein